MTIEALRTPDDRFAGLPGYDFAPNYLENLPGYDGLRMHYLDEGPRDAEVTFLCLHGEPSWSYLYRKMLRIFTGAGHRVIAPDFFGFGRSDKPVDDAVYTYHFHRNALLAAFDALDLHNVCLVCQDWGGILGLTLPMERADRFTRLIVMNTGLPVGKGMTEGFAAWKQFVADNPDFPVGELMSRACPTLSAEEVAAYDAPFPGKDHKAGVRRFPALVMVEPGMDGIDCSERALKFWSQDWTGDSFMGIGAQDPVLGPPAMMALRDQIKGCPEPLLLEEGGHFVQEQGEPIARAALAHFGI